MKLPGSTLMPSRNHIPPMSTRITPKAFNPILNFFLANDDSVTSRIRNPRY